MKDLSKEDQERIEKAAIDHGTAYPGAFEAGAKYEHSIAYNKGLEDGAGYSNKESFNEAIEEVTKHHTNMRNLMSFWDDEEGEKLKYVESHIELLNQLIEELSKLKKS
jgi:hypothetical protein